MDTAKSSDARDSDHKNRPAALVEISHQQQQQQKQLEFQGDLLDTPPIGPLSVNKLPPESESCKVAASPSSTPSLQKDMHTASESISLPAPLQEKLPPTSAVDLPFISLPETLMTDNAVSAILFKEKTALDTEYAHMEKEFTDTHTEAEQNPNLYSRFLAEYQKLFQALARTRLHAFELTSQYQEVEREYQNNLEQQLDGGKALDHGQHTLGVLKQQIKRAEQMLEQSVQREDTAKDDQRQLRLDISGLTATIKQGVSLSAAQEQTINDLIMSKEQANKDLEAELDRIVMLRNGLTEISEEIKVTETLTRENEREIFSLKEKNATKKLDIDAKMRTKERLEQSLREQRAIVTAKSQEVQGKQDAVNRATEDIAVIESHIKQQRQQIEKLLRDQESLGTRTVKLQQDYNDQRGQTLQILNENETTQHDLNCRERELTSHRAEVKKVTRIKEALQKKNHILEDMKLQVEMERKAIRSHADELMIAVDRLRRQVETMRKNIDDLTREKDLLSGAFLKTQTEIQQVGNLVLLQKKQRYNIELEIAQYRKETLEHNKEAKRLTLERDAYIAEATHLQTQYVQDLRRLKEMEIQIFEYKRQMSTSEAKLKHQQNLYEAVQSERNLHAKHLIESQCDIAEMKRKLKIMNFQINGYKDDLNSKDAIIAHESTEHTKLAHDMDLIKDEIKTLENQNDLAQNYIKCQVTEQVKLNQFVKAAEIERDRQDNALQVLVGERDNLSSQLIRRNDELTHVYDQIKTQQLGLFQGEMHYKEKLSAIHHLRSQVHDLRSMSANLTQKASGVQQMRQSIVRLQNEEMQEQMRIKALEDELKNPINVHRWRKLEGSNPQTFDMIKLLHSLQKRLIVKNKEDKEKEGFIKVQEELYLHLKNMLIKQIGPEALEQIEELGVELKNKTIQLRHMDTELNMYQAQVREYKYTIGQLDESLADSKKKFLDLYRKRVELLRNSTLIPEKGAYRSSINKSALPMLPEKYTGSLSSKESTTGHLIQTNNLVLAGSDAAQESKSEIVQDRSRQLLNDTEMQAPQPLEPIEQSLVASAAELPTLNSVSSA
ncbi:hypothetical protein BASA62_002311 [Batrachochytrium salamandrivorans]|nr:hypothetical protein BASA62_002311 [Batrachochytrium salamandrivorans]